jgi:hypothetical protein
MSMFCFIGLSLIFQDTILFKTSVRYALMVLNQSASMHSRRSHNISIAALHVVFIDNIGSMIML